MPSQVARPPTSQLANIQPVREPASKPVRQSVNRHQTSKPANQSASQPADRKAAGKKPARYYTSQPARQLAKSQPGFKTVSQLESQLANQPASQPASQQVTKQSASQAGIKAASQLGPRLRQGCSCCLTLGPSAARPVTTFTLAARRPETRPLRDHTGRVTAAVSKQDLSSRRNRDDTRPAGGVLTL